MDKEKDFVDRIIDLFSESYKTYKQTDYSIGRGKKHFYPGVDRGYVGYLISIYKQSKPDSDSETALSDFKKLFDTIINFNYSNTYLADITLYKICFKLNDYKAARNSKANSKAGFDQSSNTWLQSSSPVLTQQKQSGLIVQPDTKYFHKVTKLPEQNVKIYTDDELNVIQDELLRLAKARDENYSSEVAGEWIRCFGELNMSVSQVVKSVRLAKLQPKYAAKEFAMFLKVDTNDYYQKYPTKK